jgi:hypothetical protein
MRGFQFKSAVSQAAAETAAARASARTSAGRPRLRAPRSLLRLGPAFVIAVLILGLLPATAMATDPQTITFAPLTDRRLDESPFDLSATASSGLDVVFTSDTTPVCTVAGVSVTLHAIGLCTIDADQAGDGTWGPADTVSQSFIVTQGNQSITFDALSDRRLDETPFTISATASSTLPVVFTSETTPVCTVAGTSVTLHSAGLCTIDADQWGDDNWTSASDRTADLHSDAKGNQFITFDALSGRRLDETPFGLTASASSGLAVTYSSETTLVCTVVGAVVALHTAGLCTIDANQAGNGNWTSAAQVQRSFTVDPGQSVDHIWRPLRAVSRRVAVHRLRDRLLEPGGRVHLRDHVRLHRRRHDGHAPHCRPLHHRRQPVRQRQLDVRSAGPALVYRRPGRPDDHIWSALRPDSRRLAFRHFRNCLVRPLRYLHL